MICTTNTHHIGDKKIFVSFRKCLGNDIPQKNPFTTLNTQKIALKLLNGGMCGKIKWMSITQIWSFNYWNTSHGYKKRCLYHSGSALVLILHEIVCLPPQNAQNLALKLLNGGTFGCKKRWAPLKVGLLTVGTYHMEYTKNV